MNLITSEEGADVWNDDADLQHTDIQYVLNVLGIEYNLSLIHI